MESMKDQEEQKDRKNQKDLLAELETIENELTGYVKSDQRNWVHIYQSMSRVESEKLYKARGLSSFTAWVNSRAESMGVHVSLLWARLKAGRVYAEYAARAKARGKEAVPIDRLSNVSPDSLSLCARVAGKNADVMDRLVEKTVAGELSREDLRAAAQAKKAAGSAPAKSRYTAVTAEDRQTGIEHQVTAADIVMAIRSHREWMGAPDDNPYVDRKYHAFTEFAVDTGTSRDDRRVDVMVAETITALRRGPVILRGIEIKVSVHDLLDDKKMAEYVPFCDYFYLAVPDNEEMLAAADSVRLESWGVLAVSTDGSIRVVHPAEYKPGIMRDKALEMCVIKLM